MNGVREPVEISFGAFLVCPVCGQRLVFANGIIVQPRHKRGEGSLEVLWPSGRCDRCGEHIEAPVDVERHIVSSADNPLFILRARGTIPARSGGFVRLFVITGKRYVYAIENWPPAEEAHVEEAALLASGGDKDED